MKVRLATAINRKPCKVCGGSRMVNTAEKKVILFPDGRRMNFQLGECEDVTEDEYKFLLHYNSVVGSNVFLSCEMEEVR